MKKAIIVASLLMSSSAFAAQDPVTDLLSTFFQQKTAYYYPANTIGVKRHRVHQYRTHIGGTVASFYGGGPKKYEPNSHTANGEYFNQWGLTAAHRTLPFGTRLRVCYRGCAIVRVNDRGPSLWTGRSLDLSRGAASAIGMVSVGSARVSMEVLN